MISQEPVESRNRGLMGLLREYPWDFMVFLILALAIPRIYSLVNTFWVGHIDYSSLAIAEQYEFMGISIEIINETIPFGVLALVSQNYRSRDAVVRQLIAGMGLRLLFSTGLALFMLLNMPLFVNFIGTPPDWLSGPCPIFRSAPSALPFNSLALLLVLGLKSMDKAKLALLIVTLNTGMNMVLDLFLVSQLPFSLQS